MATSQSIVVSGAKPSGKLHIGNYLGATKNWLELQKEKNMQRYFFIADYHQMAESISAAEFRQKVFGLAADLLALGIDPKKSTLFVQSDVPEHTELFWIFNTVTPVAFLERMTQYKDKSQRQVANINAGLLEYPVLQAADILMYHGDRVPVGLDQVQHVELTRDIARFFNNKFGETFPETKPLLTEFQKVRSLTEPLKKMSKSFGEKSYIALTDEPDVIYEKMKSAVTESTGILSLSEEELTHKLSLHDDDAAQDESLRGMAGVWNLLLLLREFGSQLEFDRMIAGQPIKYGELKKLVAQRIGDHFAEFRKRRAALEKTPGKVWKILADGGKRARKEAQKTMKEVRKIVGLR